MAIHAQRDDSASSEDPYILPARPLRKCKPTDLSHLERDREGHFATKLRDEAQAVLRRIRRAKSESRYDVRYAEMMSLIALRLRPGTQIPDGLDSDEGETFIRCVAYHFQARYGSEETELWDRLTSWCMEWCENWTDGWPDKGAIIQRVLKAIEGRRQDLNAVELGKALRLTWDERCALGIRSFRPYNMTPAEFFARAKARKLEMDAQRQEANRRKDGRKTWAEHSWQAHHEPWKALGISRRTYFRRKKAEREALGEQNETRGTDVSLLGGANPTSDVTVPTVTRSVRSMSADHQTDDRAGGPRSLKSESAATATAAGEGKVAAAARQEDAATYDALCPLRAFDEAVSEGEERHARRSAA